ncbi:ataxin-1a [Gouania willdenowi]|uniref:AXH domain-containing protein n=1 Tax=Gouania willdenowi TaxID=441366 RepID=A0A8C5DD88_GOUWI|nr:ataxin-1 [Gouania willdenowi]XP_028316980.1 ataxin-1 [Gouania willdenowi]
MKSNQERSNECLPPKKREIPPSTILSENRSSPLPPASDSQRTENLTWLANVAGGIESNLGPHRSSRQSEGLQYKTPSSISNYSASLSVPTVYTSPLSQSTVGGTVHYTQLPSNMQFIASPYSASHPNYVSSQLLPPPPPPPPFSSSSSHRPLHTETTSSPSQVVKQDQQRTSTGHTFMPPPLTDSVPHHVQMSLPPQTTSSSYHLGGSLHPSQSLNTQHSFGPGMSQIVVQYADGHTGKAESSPRSRDLHNGESERGRRYGALSNSSLSKSGSKGRTHTTSLSPCDTRHLVFPSDYSSNDSSAMRTSVMLMPNSHGDHHLAPPRVSAEKMTVSASTNVDKGGIIQGRPVNRGPSLSNATNSFPIPSPLSVDGLKASVCTLPPQTVIQTTHNATQSLTMGLSSTGIYPQSPFIGYLAGSGSNYQTGLQQHLLISGTQPVIIPVSGSGVSALEPVNSHKASSKQHTPFPTTLPHTYIASTDHKEVLETTSLHQEASGAVVQAQLHLPIIPAPPGLIASPVPASATGATTSPLSLPSYFIKGSIIQLADGELKQVEDLKTEDFIQSAEISTELRIDSSTVERIEGSQTSPDFAVVQFSVGENRTQVSVEVLIEYPFFVFGQGWSSCCPDRTTELLELPCTKLSVGDVCISLTLKNLKNGSLKKNQPLEPATLALVPTSSHTKSPKAVSNASQSCSGGRASRHRERENGISQRGNNESGSISGDSSSMENGDVGFGSVSKGQATSSRDTGVIKPSGRRKRRWSAPEGRKVEKAEEEPPLTLPKPSFIPRDVKISIEGRSSIGN